MNDMLTYNTARKRLVLPEYGRNIQQMVDHCLTIENREERTQCAFTIVAAMGKLFPKIKEQDDYKQKLWDHLAIMSGFSLDIDWPVEPLTADRLDQAPERVPYTSRHIKYRHYGKDVELMIDKAAQMPEGPERDELSLMIANHMKKLLSIVAKDGVPDSKVFKDLAELSHGLIRLDLTDARLHDFNIIAPPSGKKKRKRK